MSTTHSIRPIFSAFRHELAERKAMRARRRQLRADFDTYRTRSERLELDTLLSQLPSKELDDLLAGRRG